MLLTVQFAGGLVVLLLAIRGGSGGDEMPDGPGGRVEVNLPGSEFGVEEVMVCSELGDIVWIDMLRGDVRETRDVELPDVDGEIVSRGADLLHGLETCDRSGVALMLELGTRVMSDVVGMIVVGLSGEGVASLLDCAVDFISS